jgi:hypothetical protein
MTQAPPEISFDLFRFVTIEHEQLLVRLADNREEFAILNDLQSLYLSVTSNVVVGDDDTVIWHLLSFAHYHLLFSSACLMRCHLSEAFASARAAIDGAFVAAQIIHDRASQVAYAKRTKPFDKLARHLKNLVRDQKQLPHPLVPELLKLFDEFSTFASHADASSFVHRVKATEDGTGKTRFSVEYFQFARSDAERRIHAITLFHTFVMILDIFSDFLVTEKRAVPEPWRSTLHALGARIECHHDMLKAVLPTEIDPFIRERPAPTK